MKVCYEDWMSYDNHRICTHLVYYQASLFTAFKTGIPPYFYTTDSIISRELHKKLYTVKD